MNSCNSKRDNPVAALLQADPDRERLRNVDLKEGPVKPRSGLIHCPAKGYCDSTGESGGRKRVARANAGGKWPKQMGDAVRVVADELAPARQHHEPVARLGEDATDTQHSPGAVERFADVAVVADHPRV